MDEFKQASMKDVSVGGWSCKCCGPKPGRDRDEHRRYARRRLAQQDRAHWDECFDELLDLKAEFEAGLVD